MLTLSLSFQNQIIYPHPLIYFCNCMEYCILLRILCHGLLPQFCNMRICSVRNLHIKTLQISLQKGMAAYVHYLKGCFQNDFSTLGNWIFFFCGCGYGLFKTLLTEAGYRTELCSMTRLTVQINVEFPCICPRKERNVQVERFDMPQLFLQQIMS